MARRYWNINLEEMLEAGVHFGRGTKKWNPTMAPHISAKDEDIKAQLMWKQRSSDAQAFRDVKAPNKQHTKDLRCRVNPRKRCGTTHVE
ncbi:hypothetical protein Golob_004059, partial [Gossypium lobatum]|nr:hypothetical protein [Gossypium lobatum]